MTTKNKENNFYKDLINALGEMANVKQNAKNPFFKSRYATLEDTLTMAKQVLTKHNLAVVQLNGVPTSHEGTYSTPLLVTRIVHTSGEYIEDHGVPIRCKDMSDPQKMGSAITYARRYGLQAVLGGVGTDKEDDDGNLASTEKPKPKPKKLSLKEVINNCKTNEDLDKLWEEFMKGGGKTLTPDQQAVASRLVEDRRNLINGEVNENTK